MLWLLLALALVQPPWSEVQKALDEGDYLRARALLQPPAEAGDPHAMYLLGHLLDAGFGGDPEPRRALALWLQAAEKGHPEASYRAGLAYLHGRGVDPDPERGLEILERAALFGHHPAEREIGKALLASLRGPGHVPEALTWLACAADAGDREAAELLGVALARGTEETLPEPEKAVKYLRLAQRLGSPFASQLLEELNPARDVVVADEAHVHLLRRAAQLGFPDPQFRLAVLGLANVPWGPPREEAKRLLAVAAANGHPEAAYRLLQLRRHEGPPPSPLEAEQLLRQAAEGGFAPASLELGELLAARQSPEAIRFLRLALGAGQKKAALELARIFFEGFMVPADPEEGLRLVASLAEAEDLELRRRGASLLLRFRRDPSACQVAERLHPELRCNEHSSQGSTPSVKAP